MCRVFPRVLATGGGSPGIPRSKFDVSIKAIFQSSGFVVPYYDLYPVKNFLTVSTGGHLIFILKKKIRNVNIYV